MVIIDKTAWQIDGGIPEDLEACYDEYLRVIARINTALILTEKNLRKCIKNIENLKILWRGQNKNLGI